MQSQSQLWDRSGTEASQYTCIVIITANRVELFGIWEANTGQHKHHSHPGPDINQVESEELDPFVLPSVITKIWILQKNITETTQMAVNYRF